MNPEFLVTHSGGFHADELCSTAVLTTLFPEAKVIRSRSKEWITASDGKIVYDVGGVYDAKSNAFDHHQKNAPLRDDGQPFSSFGLIWRHFGKRYLIKLGIPSGHIDLVHDSIDQSFVQPIDLLDNGAIDPTLAGRLSPLTLPNLLETLKPDFDAQTPETEQNAFEKAARIAKLFIEAQVSQAEASLRAEKIVLAAIDKAGSNRVLELPRGMPYWSTLNKAKADHFLFIVHPRGQDDWTLGGIRAFKDGFDLRADLPKEWGGLTNDQLETATGVRGATFCHNGLFIAAAKTREAIIAMAQLAVENAQNQGK